MLKIDMHAHILPEDWPNLGAKYNTRGFPYLERHDGRCLIMRDGEFFREIWPNCWDDRVRIEEYETFGVDVQVISTVPVMFCYDQPAALGLEIARFLNDDVARRQHDHPRRIIALGTLPMQDVSLAIEELRRLREQLDVRGVQIGSNINDRNLDDAELFPVFEAAEDLGMAILVHPWQMMGRDKMPRFWLPWLVGMPAELSRAICSMIFGGVLERLPGLRICFAHGGGSFPYTIGRIEHGFNVRPDLVATDNPVNPREYLGRFFVDSVTHDPQALRYLLDVVGDDQVMLGTDYPFPLGEQEPGRLIESLGMPAATRAKLFHANALRWLGLDADAFR
ncbi:MAG: amidohydrolase family protein [Xanthomonadales bacterium]|uniref:amidohydrolase family protein n=1 Tax=Hydrogenophaga sp. TaxID=1904254 RepID=UPI0016B0FB34|nr:amidohydrolase family protein [Hydrogenophaga sp.]NIM70689.1 amidohydrolase family protein [Xanthomonadales bacterium]NIN33444.1 amidohydrolase family protein [Hydrogenophaga sp.]NIN59966.1 amidohydrolase family protein [Xanthomonadales bacterium]NIN75339.1 amidohydrolase family protein [Xanthomonadales bacterium]NIO13508.1 amidohydrolase family protein [Xanthomonadales bacterium]